MEEQEDTYTEITLKDAEKMFQTIKIYVGDTLMDGDKTYKVVED